MSAAWEYDRTWDTLSIDPRALPRCDEPHEGPCVLPDGRIEVPGLMTLVHRTWKRYMWSLRAITGRCDGCRHYTRTSEGYGRCTGLTYGEHRRAQIVPAGHGCKVWEGS